jgi:hypothetical protein
VCFAEYTVTLTVAGDETQVESIGVHFMKHIQFVIILVIFLLMGFSVAAENTSDAEITVKSQQRLTEMREELGLDENHSFQMQSLQHNSRGQTHVRFQQFHHDVGITVTETGSSGIITFSATTTNNVRITKVEFYVDNSLKGTDTKSPYSMRLDSLNLKNGNYTLVGKAYDAAGNIGTSASIPFTINNTETPSTYNEVENNATIQTANVIADTVTNITAYIGAANDKDYFKINVAAGHSATIKMTGPAKDYDLYLLSSSGTTLKNSANTESNESVTYKNASVTTATYYIKAVAFSGAYTLTTPYNLVLSR